MNTYIGIDLGTSSLKALLCDEEGKILREESQSYPIFTPKPNWSEQNPRDWESALYAVLGRLVQGFEKTVCGLSFGGQMHGLVALDGQNNVIRPCILWNDGRTQKETDFLNEQIGKSTLSARTGNIAFAGFTAPKLLWLYENERENFDKIAKIMLPKDYLCFLLTGKYATDYSDASGTLLLDVCRKTWSKQMCEICHIQESQLPTLYESYDVVGNLKEDLCVRFGLRKDVKITAGAGDNAAAAIGTATVNDGDTNISIGTSGTVFIAEQRFSVDRQNALHSFAHANGAYHLMGCILSGASCRKWFLEDILGSSDYEAEEEAIRNCSSENVLFVPYLNGERSPHNDVSVRGGFLGLSATTTKAQMSRAVMEGVAFAIRDCVEIAKENGVFVSSSNLCGGGAKSDSFCQIFADALGIPMILLATEQGPSYGACILAMVGCGAYPTVKDACAKIVKIKKTVLPNPEQSAFLEKKYQSYKKCYACFKKIYE